MKDGVEVIEIQVEKKICEENMESMHKALNDSVDSNVYDSARN